ncbi:MAG: TrbI/VirB10 family protein [Pseudomonadota bacterium]
MPTDPKSRAFSDLDRAAPPRVALPAQRWVMPTAVLGCLMLGGVVFLELNANRTRSAAAEETATTTNVQPAPVHLPPPPPPPQPLPMLQPAPPSPAPAAAQGDAERTARLASRAMIVDLSDPQNTTSSAPGANGAAINPRDVTDAAGGGRDDAFGQGSNEIFASRLSRQAGEARATPPGDLSQIVPEGAVIPAVLETALNSDLPGYTRALVSRDVLSFDGKNVLIPRGSRLIGQYRSAVALGQSRAFVVWTRLVRPDGVNIQLADPGTDALGRGGLEGHVDTHFMRRFGGAILLTLLSAGANAVASSNDANTAVIIGSTQSLGAQTVGQTQNVAPTVDVPQGTPIRIFVTRDLDFSDVGAAQ